MTREQLIGAIAALEKYGSDPVNRHVGLQKLRAQLAALPEPAQDAGPYKLFVWTDHCTFAAVAHAKTVAQARELIEGEDLGGYDASCQERVAARKMIYGETPGIYRGPQAVLMFDTGKSEEPEQPRTDRERRLREVIEKAAERLSRDPEDVEYVDSCPHCGDGAIDNIDSDEWEFDSHGDMLCRLCGGHRGLCGYSTGGGNEVVAIFAEPSPTPSHRTRVTRRWRRLLSGWKLRRIGASQSLKPVLSTILWMTL